ncbi:hypothetical protein [Streptomyces misionensis]|uniref:hypothetical protein n=1 Tax=Streptomyces misionensis TaxID=67331 RepID=UPI00340ED0E2
MLGRGAEPPSGRRWRGPQHQQLHIHLTGPLDWAQRHRTAIADARAACDSAAAAQSAAASQERRRER